MKLVDLKRIIDETISADPDKGELNVGIWIENEESEKLRTNPMYLRSGLPLETVYAVTEGGDNRGNYFIIWPKSSLQQASDIMTPEQTPDPRGELEKAIMNYFKILTGNPITPERAAEIAEELVPTKKVSVSIGETLYTPPGPPQVKVFCNQVPVTPHPVKAIVR